MLYLYYIYKKNYLSSQSPLLIKQTDRDGKNAKTECYHLDITPTSFPESVRNYLAA